MQFDLYNILGFYNNRHNHCINDSVTLQQVYLVDVFS